MRKGHAELADGDVIENVGESDAEHSRNDQDPVDVNAGMSHALAAKDQWYVVHVLSGQENKVRENILKRVKTEEMGDLVYDVLVPTERVSEIKKGKKSETTRKFFPGYLIVNMS